MKIKNGHTLIPIGLIVILGIIGFLLILYATQLGPWAYSDSTVYIVSARNLLAGRGLGIVKPSGTLDPLSHFPPLFPLTLSALGLFGIDLVVAARWLNALLFGSTVLMVGVFLNSLTGWPLLSIAVSVVILTSPVLLDLHSGAMSEPLFFFTGLMSLFLMVFYLKSGKRTWLISTAIAAGMASVTRYIGSAYLITGVLSLLLVRRCAFKRRIADILVYSLVGGLPMILFLGWLNSPSIQSHPRLYQFNTGNLWFSLIPVRKAIVNELLGWIPFADQLPPFSYRTKLVIVSVIAFLFLFLIAVGIRRRQPARKDWRIHNGFLSICVFILFIIPYIGMMTFAYLYAWPKPGSGLGERMFSPVYLALLVSIFLVWFFLCSSITIRVWHNIVPITASFLLVASSIPNSFATVRSLHNDGRGFTSKSWRASETIEALKGIPPETFLISNEEEAILFHTNRPAYDIPELRRSEPLPSFQRFGDDDESNVQRLFREQGAALVLFHTINVHFYPLYHEDVDQRLKAFTMDLYLYGEYADGAIYFHNKESAGTH